MSESLYFGAFVPPGRGRRTPQSSVQAPGRTLQPLTSGQVFAGLGRNRGYGAGMMKRLIFTLLAAAPFVSLAGDWPHWRGPDRNGISQETGWQAEWPGDGPPVVWKAELGTGFASFAVADGRVFTTGHASEQDTVFCFEMKTGKVLWKHSYAAELGDKYYEGGTSATPTVADGRVYHLSRWGDAMCLEAATGKVVWQRNILEETGVPVPDWGFAGSPVVSGDLVLLSVGEHGTALAKSDGALRWKSPEKAAGYSTPLPLGDGTAVFSSDKAWTGVEMATGKKVWAFPWNTRYGVNAADPVPGPAGQLFIASGYNKGCAVIRLGGETPEKVWENKVMRSQFNSCVLINGYLYGPDGNDSDKGTLRCVEMKSGEVKWEQKGFGVGGVTASDGKLIALSAQGELFIAPVSPEKFAPLTQAQVLGGRCWTTPVLSNGLVFCRNAGGEVVCLQVKP